MSETNDVPESTDVSEPDPPAVAVETTDPAPPPAETTGWRLVATRPRRLVLVALTAVAIVAAGFVAIGMLSGDSAVWVAPTEQFGLEGPETIAAGDAWNLVVDRPITDATLTVTGPTGSTTVELAGTFDDVTVPFSFPTDDMGALVELDPSQKQSKTRYVTAWAVTKAASRRRRG